VNVAWRLKWASCFSKAAATCIAESLHISKRLTTLFMRLCALQKSKSKEEESEGSGAEDKEGKKVSSI
jgi:hypothetical protein